MFNIYVGITIFGLIPISLILFFIICISIIFMFNYIFNIKYRIMKNTIIRGIDEASTDEMEPLIIVILSMVTFVPVLNILISLVIWKIFIIFIIRSYLIIKEK